MFLVQVWHKCHGTDALFLPANDIFHAVRFNTVAFVGNSFHSIRSLQLYIAVLEPAELSVLISVIFSE